MKGHGQEEARVHRIRITLTSKNVKNLEKGKFTAASKRSYTPDFYSQYKTTTQQYVDMSINIMM